MRKRNVEPYTKKKSILILCIAIICFILAYASLIVGAELRKNNADSKIFLPFYYVVFPLCIGDMIFLIYHMKGIQLRNINNQTERTKSTGYKCFESINEDINGYFTKHRFKVLEEGYYYKRKFSLLKDYINFYIKKI